MITPHETSATEQQIYSLEKQIMAVVNRLSILHLFTGLGIKDGELIKIETDVQREAREYMEEEIRILEMKLDRAIFYQHMRL